VEGISFQGPGEDEMKEQQQVDPELAWVVRWRETGEEPTEGELFIGPPPGILDKASAFVCFFPGLCWISILN
jgi:hypothetical protein